LIITSPIHFHEQFQLPKVALLFQGVAMTMWSAADTGDYLGGPANWEPDFSLIPRTMPALV